MESRGKIKVSGGLEEDIERRGDLIRECLRFAEERDGSKSRVAEGGCQLMELRTMRIC